MVGGHRIHGQRPGPTFFRKSADHPIAPSLAFASRQEPFRFAQIGCGGKGESDRDAMLNAGAKLVALCDVDENNAKKVFAKHADLPKYKDFRELLDKHEKEIDGVVV